MEDEQISSKIREISPFIVMEILERAMALEARGFDIVHMEIGEPDFDPPAAAVDAAIEALATRQTKYTHSLGLRELREAIAADFERKYKRAIDADRVVITTGTSAGMLLTFTALVNPGDEILITDPCYPCYPNFIKLAGGTPVFMALSAAEGWLPDPDRAAKLIGSRTKAMIINSPANPTGAIIPPETMRKLADLTDGGPLLLSDEIYHGMVYGEQAHSILEFTDHAVVINGFSKLYAMTGWRLGYLIVPPALVRPVQKLQQNLFISAPTVAQIAAVAALKEGRGDVEQMVSAYNERRQFLLPALEKLGFRVELAPTGAFYVLADARHLSNDSYSLALDILDQAHVAVTPGRDFGAGAEGYLRFSYATSLENIAKAIGRLERWLEVRHGP